MKTRTSSPLVSVGIPVRNGGEQIKTLIANLLTQSYSNLEIIVSDNASEDSTVEFIKRVQLKDSRIKLLVSEILIPANRNFQRVLDAASGEYFMWAAHDDYHSLDFIEKNLEKLEESDSYKACQSGVNFCLDTANRLIYKGRFNSLVNSRNPAQLYLNILHGINSLFFYALFKTREAKSISPLRAGPGAELLWLFEFSLRYKVIQVPFFNFFYTLRSSGVNQIEVSNAADISKLTSDFRHLLTFYFSFFTLANKHISKTKHRIWFQIVFFLDFGLRIWLSIVFRITRGLLSQKIKRRMSIFAARNFRSLNRQDIQVVDLEMYMQLESSRFYRRWFSK